MNKPDFNLLLIPLDLISHAGGEMRGKTRLQKLIFLSQKEFDGEFDFNFDKAPLGPLSYDLFNKMDELIELGLISRDEDRTDFGYKVFKYKITENGRNFLEFGKSRSLISKNITDANKKTIDKYGKKSHMELLDYVHEKYPKFQVKM
jgi:hypothetical protein